MKKIQIACEIALPVVLFGLLVGCGKGEGDSKSGKAVVLPATTGALSYITISPAASSVAACTPLQLTATAHYADGSTDPNVAFQWGVDVGSAGRAVVGASGVVTGLVSGLAEIDGWAGSTAYASAVLNITSVAPIAISGPASAVSGSSAVFSATASCAAVSAVADVSHLATWTSSDSRVASMLAANPITFTAPGTFATSAVGSANITAAVSGVSAMATLQVR
ncbi:MAG: hypothetical protein EPO42_02030 [Gallionellaceae bacterium]|nr:MAG: hypothetical protein EPO42_02030 [Gallionellaceae bacterium]